MKNKFATITLLLFTLNVYSQQAGKVKFGIKLGAVFAKSKIEYTGTDYPYNFNMKTGLSIGGYADFLVSKNFVFQPALLYVRKGAKVTGLYSYNEPLYFNYFEIPLNILYRPAAKKGMYFFGIGLSPAIRLNYYYNGSQLKSFDLGINALAGYQFPIGFSINLNYTYGIMNVSENKEFISTIQNKYFSLTVGYEF